ncbi:MAG: APC family permease [Sulfurospirillum sp.]
MNQTKKFSIHRKRGKALGVFELIAIAVGGMVGGGIFTVLGISVALVGAYSPVAIAIGGVIAMLAAYNYVKLGVYFKDEGATYSFYKKTFPSTPFAASLIGWWVIFGYISTLALYAYTFSSYSISSFSFAGNEIIRKSIAGAIILIFALINIWSVKGMGRIEDLMVYTKMTILAAISILLIYHSDTSLPVLLESNHHATLFSILIVSSLTFVAYEGFQLVINAVNEMKNPDLNIPRAIYAAIVLVILIYVIISLGAILSIPFKEIIDNKEYALAAGAKDIMGNTGANLVIAGALLATSSAISGTLFGSSRQASVIAEDGYFPSFLAIRKNSIPVYAIISMALFSFGLILIGNLEVILEFGSITFILVSWLMAFANLKIRDKTNSSLAIIVISLIGLFLGASLIVYYEVNSDIKQIYFTCIIYFVLTLGAWLYSKFENKKVEKNVHTKQ